MDSEQAAAAILTEKNGIRALSICGIGRIHRQNSSCKSLYDVENFGYYNVVFPDSVPLAGTQKNGY